ncbi:hypothetical protein BV20DRAFT_1036857 [Pilatotrama ljubarskyi]|nr:hypothetical protein BV20DRAFT_1036857 [Pilatotrama ljubarskyi]
MSIASAAFCLWPSEEVQAPALGGSRLLYALSHSHGFPSLSTLHRCLRIPCLLPCITTPKEREISDNIASLFDPQRKPPMLIRSPHAPSEAEDDQARRPLTAGLLLMLNGVAIEERCRYALERNSIIGLCREHSQNIRTRVTGYDVIQEAEVALHGSSSGDLPTCHYGKDATVVAIAPYARVEHYSPVPLLVSSSCKTESEDELAGWLRTVVEAWRTHLCGEHVHGPITALGSDGESTFRRARFILCLTELLDKTALLGRLLYSLPGFNCYTGPHGICGTCDPKHVIKRESRH